MKNILRFLGGIIIAIAILVYLGLHVSSSSSSHASVSASTSTPHGALQGQLAPDFELTSLDGRRVKLSDLRRKVVLINFWATWCAPCRVEMPWFVDLNKRYQLQGLAFVGIDMDDPGQQKQVEKFVLEMNVDYTILLGNNTVGDSYGGVRFLPQTFFISRDGKITKSTFGIREKAELEDDIKQLLGAGARN